MKDEGWINCEEQLPKPGILVDILSFEFGFSKREAKLRILSDHIAWDTGNGYACNIKKWRPIPEKIPDFSKLNNGDFILIEYHDRKEIYPVFLEKFSSGYLKAKTASQSDFFIVDFAVDCIKKITRINLKEKTFEEI